MAETIEVNYLAYTLRLWRPDVGGRWRATLYNPQTSVFPWTVGSARP